MPMTWACPAYGDQAGAAPRAAAARRPRPARSAGRPHRASPVAGPGDEGRRRRRRRPTAVDRLDRSGRGTRTTSASPCPPPPHSAAAPVPPPRRASSSARCSTIRAPLMPIGWPSAIAPPLTLTLSSSMPSSRLLAMPDRGERLVDLDQVEVGRARCPPWRRPRRSPGPAATAGWSRVRRPCRARRSRPASVRPSASASVAAHHDDRAGAVGDLRGRPGRDGAVGGEGRPQLAEALGRGVAADALVVA